MNRCLVVALAVLGLTACSAAPPPTPPPHTTAHPTPTTTPTPTEPTAACVGEKAFHPLSPPYAGPGPHRVLGVDRSLDFPSDLPPDIVPPDPPTLFPDSWAADYQDTVPGVFTDVPTEVDYEHAQLILCMSVPQATSTVVGTCRYVLGDIGPLPDTGSGPVGSPVDVVSASYQFTLFEARTGRLVTSFQLTSSDPTYCPTGLSMGEMQYKIAAAPSVNDIVAKLQPFVEGPAG
ncbi:MAG TPA: hypothetical protein VHZ97_29300 [Pseudonocardiaceae bacterium]|nr:hypothetical protein [Pseudonocardiaceae bacterium]